MAPKTLSLCMVVQDVAGPLASCLPAAAFICDDLCVVDRGSKDNTRAVLQAHGANILTCLPTADRATALEMALNAAQGTWVLVLDAHEQLSADLAQSIHLLKHQQQASAATFAMRYELTAGVWHESHVLRLFRNDLMLTRLEPCDGDVTGAVLARMRQHPRPMGRLAGTAEHVGFAAAQLPFTAYAQQHARDLYSRFRQLEWAKIWDDRPRGLRAAEEALVLLDEEGDLRGRYYAGELLTLAAETVLCGEDAATLWTFLQPWEPRLAPNAAFLLRCGELQELLGNTEAAAKYFHGCRALEHATVNAQLATVRPLLGLARLALRQGDTADALELLNQALVASPRDLEALLALAFLGRRLGGAPAAQAITEAYVQTYGHTPELHGAMGEAALQAGDGAAAVKELRLALAQEPHSASYAALLEQALRA